VADYRPVLDGRAVAEWQANDTLPSDQPNGHTSTRKTVRGILLRTGDEVRLETKPDRKDHADLDYVEVAPAAGR
jgi:hypothetical protein